MCKCVFGFAPLCQFSHAATGIIFVAIFKSILIILQQIRVGTVLSELCPHLSLLLTPLNAPLTS